MCHGMGILSNQQNCSFPVVDKIIRKHGFELPKINPGGHFFSIKVAIPQRIALSQQERPRTIHQIPPAIQNFQDFNAYVLITKEGEQRIRQDMMEVVKDFKKKNPLTDRGVTLNELMGKLKIKRGSASEEVLKETLRDLTQKGKLTERDKTWIPGDRVAGIDEKMKSHLDFFSNRLLLCGIVYHKDHL